MDYNSISQNLFITTREITLKEVGPSPIFFVKSICLLYINMFTKFDEIPALTLQDIKETKRYRGTHRRTK